jgi:hypothetical protein
MASLFILFVFSLFFGRRVLVIINNVGDVQLQLHIFIFYFLRSFFYFLQGNSSIFLIFYELARVHLPPFCFGQMSLRNASTRIANHEHHMPHTMYPIVPKFQNPIGSIWRKKSQIGNTASKSSVMSVVNLVAVLSAIDHVTMEAVAEPYAAPKQQSCWSSWRETP